MSNQALESQDIKEKNNYIARWADEKERYVNYNEDKKEYFRVDLQAAQRFHTRQEAEEFAAKVAAAGLPEPEIIPVEVQPIA
jgi:hypothetical protein